MGTARITESTSLHAALPAERARLVRLCAAYSGDAGVAEDLAQEVLIEAWRHEQELRNPRARRAWLGGIARNVTLRWARSRGRDAAHSYRARLTEQDTTENAIDALADPFDLEGELERKELALLLDRAMALLPSETRAVLVARYIQDTPPGEIARRMGLSEGTVAVRLHRGRLALRRVLSTALRPEAASFGLVDEAEAEWQETRIWCPSCGRRRLMGRFRHEAGSFNLRCPDCCPDYRSPAAPNMASAEWPELFKGVKGYQAALTRLMTVGHQQYLEALPRGAIHCGNCGQLTRLRTGLPDYLPWLHWLDVHWLYAICETCGSSTDFAVEALLLWSPAGRRFWREHSRIRMLPYREVEAGGHTARVVSFQALSSAARLDMVFSKDTLQVLGVFGPTGEGNALDTAAAQSGER